MWRAGTPVTLGGRPLGASEETLGLHSCLLALSNAISLS